jgi:hypothetical protein
MTNTDYDCQKEIDKLRATQRLLTSQIFNLQEGMAEVLALLALMPKPKPKKIIMPLADCFPTKETLVQIKGQLFHNAPNRNGKRGGARPHEHVLKLGFWACEDIDIKKFADGTVMPLYFPIRRPTDIQPRESMSMLANLLDIGAALIGCREIKGFGRTAGTRLNENQAVAVMADDRSLVIADEDWPAVQISNPVTPSASDDPSLPVEIWTWRR